MAWSPEFEVAFNPRTVAIVGVSEASSATRLHGTTFIRNFQKQGFAGRIYPINPKAEQIAGLRTYPSLASVPEPIDLVIVSVPSAEVPSVLEHCIAIRAKNIHIYTAGFAETGEEEGRQLEEKIKEIAQKGDLHIVGPNCMGVSIPSTRMITFSDAPVASGPVAFLSQSGGNASMFSSYAQGFGFSKIISYGNGCVMDCTDFLEYLATDSDTKIITIYLEGVKKGQKLIRQVKEINRFKPVIIWKGGLTEFGARAVASHTGSLAGSEVVWGAFFRQTGAVPVNSLDELTDVTMTFLHLSPPPLGGRVALLMGGGGHSVASADFCAREGLEVPLLSAETRKKLHTFVPVAGTSVKNPLDAEILLRRMELFEQSLELVADDPVVDILIINQYLDILLETGGMDAIRNMEGVLCRFARQNPHHKPLVAVIETWGRNPRLNEERARLQREFLQAGIAVHRTLARAARAVAKWVRYHQFQQEILR